MKPFHMELVLLGTSQTLRVQKLIALAVVGMWLATGASAPAAGQKVRFEAIYGGGFSIVALPLPLVHLEGTGTGQATHLGNMTPVLRAVVNALAITQNPVPFTNGILVFTAPNGDEVQARFEGESSPPDPSGFMNVSARFTVAGGKGRFSGASGSGTFTGVINFFKGVFVASLNGMISPPR